MFIGPDLSSKECVTRMCDHKNVVTRMCDHKNVARTLPLGREGGGGEVRFT